jgi:protein O-GlcNAc transferase
MADTDGIDADLRAAAEMLRAGRAEEGAALLAEVARRAPDRLDVLGALANAQAALGRHADAVEVWHAARVLAPAHPSVHHNLGNSLLALGRTAEAAAAYETAVRLKPDHAGAWHQLGVARMRLQATADALACLARARTLAPADPEFALTEAACLTQAGRWSDAIALYRALVRDRPTDWRATGGLAGCLTGIGAAREADAHYRAAIAGCPDPAARRRLVGNRLLALQYRDDLPAADLTAAHAAAFEGPPPARPTPRQREDRRSGDGRIRIGYLSGDFCGHPVARFLLPVLRAHDRARVAVFAFSNTPAEDAMTDRIRAAVDGWRPVTGMTAEAAADVIREAGIDVLVDLSGHTAGNRLDVLALRPAPVQWGWLGYPGPWALPFVDARLTDALVDPPGGPPGGPPGDPGPEPVIRLPGCMVAWEEGDAPPLPPRTGNRIVFGSFNTLAKVGDATLALWAAVLAAVPESELLIKGKGAADPAVATRVRAAMGETFPRVRLLGWEDGQRAHLARYGDVDVALDTFPYNGTTTTVEALSMGVPVVSLAGDRPAARMGLTILTAASLPHLAVDTAAAYVAAAVMLAAEIRARGRRPRPAGPFRLGDVAALARGIEAAASLRHPHHEVAHRRPPHGAEQRQHQQQVGPEPVGPRSSDDAELFPDRQLLGKEQH